MEFNPDHADLVSNWNMAGRIKGPIIIMTIVLGIVVMFQIWRSTQQSTIPIPNEKAAALALLEEKLSGPRYFKAPVTGNKDPDGLWIKIEQVRLQEERVILERHWDQRQREELERLISQISEPEPSRMVGGYRIPLDRLNLALDTINK
jgi:hypothetical protein